MNAEPLTPASTIYSYLNIDLNEQNPYLTVSTRWQTLSARKSCNMDDDAIKQKQRLLFEKVIEKLLSASPLKLPHEIIVPVSTLRDIVIKLEITDSESNPISLNSSLELQPEKKIKYQILELNPSKLERNQEKSKANADQLLELKADIVTAYFFKKITGLNLKGTDIERFHRNTLANALIYHKQQYLLSDLRSSTSSSDLTLHESPPKTFTISRSTATSSSDLSIKSSMDEPEAALKVLGTQGLAFCQCYWTYKHCNQDENYGNALKLNCQNIAASDLDLLLSSTILQRPQLGILLQEQVIRGIHESFLKEDYFGDIHRMFKYVTLSTHLENCHFSYQPPHEKLEQEKHDCDQFGKFLFTILGILDTQNPADHPIMKLWEERENHSDEIVKNSSKNKKPIHLKKNKIKESSPIAASLEDSGTLFLKLISESAKNKELNCTENKLKRLLSSITQLPYTIPTFGMIPILPKIKVSTSINNRCHEFKFLTSSQIEICVSNTIKFTKEEQNKEQIPFIELKVDNLLSTDLSESTSWSSKITAQVIPSANAIMSDIQTIVIEPLGKMGIDVKLSETLLKHNSQAL